MTDEAIDFLLAGLLLGAILAILAGLHPFGAVLAGGGLLGILLWVDRRRVVDD